MAELTVLETKLAEVIGLAQAAQGTGEKVSGLLDDSDLKSELDRMQKEAEETERRGTRAGRKPRRKEDSDPRESP